MRNVGEHSQPLAGAPIEMREREDQIGLRNLRHDHSISGADASVRAAEVLLTTAGSNGIGGKEFKVTKDAPQVILELSANAGEIKPAAFSLYCASEPIWWRWRGA